MPQRVPEPTRQRPPLAALILTLVVIIILVILFSADGFLNGFVQEKLTAPDSAGNGPAQYLGRLHLSPWTLRVQCDSIALRTENGRLSLRSGPVSLSGIRWYLLALGLGLHAGELSVQAPRLALARDNHDSTSEAESSTPPTLPSLIRPLRIDRVYIAGGSFHSGRNSSLELSSGEIRGLALEQVPTTLEEALRSFTDLQLDVGSTSWQDAPDGYRYSFTALACNTDAGYIRVDSLRIKPAVSDSAFLAVEPTRTSRFNLSVPHAGLEGLAFAGMRAGEGFRAHTFRIDHPVVNVLIDRRKPDDIHPERRMPNEIFSTMESALQLDSVQITDGTVTFEELFPYSSRYALLRWTGVGGTIANIRNRPSDTEEDAATARADLHGTFLGESEMRLSAQLPLGERSFSLSCSGSLGSLDLTKLNSFLEVSDRTRVTGGKARKVDFSFRVADGTASGTTLPLYSGLKIATLSQDKGSDKGIVQAIKSLFANTFVITDANPPQPEAQPKQGTISYARKPTDPFFGYLWFSLRSGLGDVVGFSTKEGGK